MRGVDVALMSGALSLALAGAGCFSPAPALGLPCSADGACPAGQTCNTATVPPTCEGVASPVDAGGDVIDATRPPDATSCAAGCPADAPICDPETQLCRGCIADAECSTGACFETDGTCVAEAAVLYVAPGGSGMACTRLAPCGAISGAMAQATVSRAFVAVAAGAYADSILVWPTFEVRVSGADRRPETVEIEQAAAGMPIIDVPIGGVAVIEGVTTTGATGNVGIRCRGTCTLRRIVSSFNADRGLDVYSTATILVEDSTFERNGGIGVDCNGTIVMTRSISAHNGDTGVLLGNAQFDVANSFVFSNGNGMVTGGGVSIGGTVAPGSRFEFNTVVDNRALDMTRGGGLHCAPNMTTAVVANSIFARNSAPNVLVAAGCSASYVLTSAGAVAGTGNVVADPLFVDEMGEDFHITSASPARGAADPGATLGSDCDGESRPAPAGTRRDIGADEVP
jgi:hypothetical protein